MVPNCVFYGTQRLLLAENKMENDPTLSMSCPHLSRNRSLTTLTKLCLPLVDISEKKSFTGISKGKSAYTTYLNTRDEPEPSYQGSEPSRAELGRWGISIFELNTSWRVSRFTAFLAQISLSCFRCIAI